MKRVTHSFNSANLELFSFRDRVSAIERGLIRMLTDDKGIPLDPSKWRIHLTANGDVVIMSLDNSSVQFGNDRMVNFVKVEPA